jgi:hypothetical protein
MQDDMGGKDDSRKAKKGEPSVSGLDVSWTAGESIDHERGVLWYVVTTAIVMIALGLNFWLQGVSFSSISLAVLIVVVFVALLTVSRRPARELHYSLSDEGLDIEGQLHPFSEFRAFGVHQNGAAWQLTLIPVKRFGLNIEMFIHDDQGEAIVDAIGARLPMEETKVDLLDKIIHKLKIG